MLHRLSVYAARRPLVRKLVMSAPVVRDLAWRFVAGEDLEAGLAAARALRARGIEATLNHVGTHVRDEAAAVAAAGVAVDALRRLAAERLEPNVSLKLTQIGLDLDETLCRAQLRRVLEAARAVGGFVRVDMEESRYVDRTLLLFEEARDAHGPDTVGIVVQSYLRRRRDDLERLVAGGSRIRLVKGGYWESAEVVYRRKAEIDAAFAQDIDLVVARGRSPAIATHDPVAIERVGRAARAARLDRRAFELQFLYGVRPDLQDELVRAGHRVRSYVPFGAGWYEYVLGCVRRLPGGMFRRIGEGALARRGAPEGAAR